MSRTARGHNPLVSFLMSLSVFFRYNATHVFAGKFLYFLLAGLALFLAVVIIYVLNEPAPPGANAVYGFLLAPGVLLIFYPSVYAIQADADARMLETLFGVPDYRYKVWLARYVTQYIVVAVLLLALGLFCRISVTDFPLWSMIFHLMFPIVFLGSFGFMSAAITRSGNGAAVIVVTFFLILFIGAEALEGSRWNLFHNPFSETGQFDYILQQETTLYNRIYLLVGSVICTLFAMFRLMQREKLVS